MLTTRVSAVADRPEVRAFPETGEQCDDYIPSGCIPDVLKGTVHNLKAGCYSFAEILDLAAHHLVWIGEAKAVEAQLRSGAVTVRAFLRERYGVCAGASEQGDKSDRKRFGLWMADARWRIRRLRRNQLHSVPARQAFDRIPRRMA